MQEQLHLIHVRSSRSPSRIPDIQTSGERYGDLPFLPTQPVSDSNPAARESCSASMSFGSCVGVVIYQGFAMELFVDVLPDLSLFLHLRTHFSPARPSTLNTIAVNCSVHVRNLCDQTLVQSHRYELLIGRPSAQHVSLTFLAQGGEPCPRFFGTF